jgi:RNA polymerase sigma-70 factor (ECF subfamily)
MQTGDIQPLSSLFNEYYQALCRFVYLYISEKETTEELAANVFISLWENKHKINIKTSLKAYLYKSAKNQAMSYLRKKRIESVSIEDNIDFIIKEKTPESIFIEKELDKKFAQAFSKLPNRAKLAFKLHRFDGLRYSEIAEIMAISVPAVEKNITTALKILHKELKNSIQVF